MKIEVAEAAARLEARGVLVRERYPDQSDKIISHVRELIGCPLPLDLENLYRERIESVGYYSFLSPHWNDWPDVGWHKSDWWVKNLLHVQAVPIAGDGCGNYFGLDLSADGVPAVYLFDHELDYKIEHCAGSSLGAFLLVLANKDQAYKENWPDRWQLSIDPDIDKCPRARAIWNAG